MAVAVAAVPAGLDQECRTLMDKLDMMVAMLLDHLMMVLHLPLGVGVVVAVPAQAGMVIMGNMELVDLMETPEMMVLLMLEIWVMLIPEIPEIPEILEILDLQENLGTLEMMVR